MQVERENRQCNGNSMNLVFCKRYKETTYKIFPMNNISLFQFDVEQLVLKWSYLYIPIFLNWLAPAKEISALFPSVLYLYPLSWELESSSRVRLVLQKVRTYIISCSRSGSCRGNKNPINFQRAFHSYTAAKIAGIPAVRLKAWTSAEFE